MLRLAAQLPPLIVKSPGLALAAGMRIWPIVKAAVPVLLSVTVAGLLVWPTVSEPKLAVGGDTDGVAAAVVAAQGSVAGVGSMLDPPSARTENVWLPTSRL